MTPVQLPEVPAPSAWAMTDYQPEANTQFTMRVDAAEHYASVGLQVEPLYTAAQLREYATAAVMAERARLAGLLSRTIRDAVFKNFDQSASRYKVITGPSTIALSVQVEVLALLTPSETNSER